MGWMALSYINQSAIFEGFAFTRL